MLTRKARLLLSLTAATPLLFVGCTEHKILNPIGDVSGTYLLTVYANVNVPATFTASPGQDPELPNGGTVLVTDGTLVLGSDGSFVETNNYTKTPPTGTPFQSQFVSTGTYTVSGTTISLSAPQQNGFAARLVSGTVTVNSVSYLEGGVTYAYAK